MVIKNKIVGDYKCTTDPAMYSNRAVNCAVSFKDNVLNPLNAYKQFIYVIVFHHYKQ